MPHKPPPGASLTSTCIHPSCCCPLTAFSVYEWWPFPFRPVLTVGSFFPCIYYGFFCDPHLQTFYLTCICVAGIGEWVCDDHSCLSWPQSRPSVSYQACRSKLLATIDASRPVHPIHPSVPIFVLVSSFPSSYLLERGMPLSTISFSAL